MRCPWAAGRNVGGHYKWHFGPSEVRATSGANLGRPLFLVIIPLLLLLAPVVKIQSTTTTKTIPVLRYIRGVISKVVLGFGNFA